MIDVQPDIIPRSRRTCRFCEATPAGCRSKRALTGRYCCSACDDRRGDHDTHDRKEATS